MKVTVDIGNTNIMFAFFIDKKVIGFKRLRTKEASLNKVRKIISKYSSIDIVIVSSVVPLIDKLLVSYFDIIFL